MNIPKNPKLQFRPWRPARRSGVGRLLDVGEREECARDVKATLDSSSELDATRQPEPASAGPIQTPSSSASSPNSDNCAIPTASTTLRLLLRIGNAIRALAVVSVPNKLLHSAASPLLLGGCVPTRAAAGHERSGVQRRHHETRSCR